jgi:secreted trypsin-like serine protease
MRITAVLLLILSILTGMLTSCAQSSNHEFSKANSLTSAQIIGGNLADQNEFPFLVNIWMNSPEDGYVAHHCGASLIAKKWLLTAAHCLMEDKTETLQAPVNPNSLILFIGSHRISGEGAQKLKAKAIHIHPKFSWPNFDIALIELAEPVENVAPVVLSSEDYSHFATGTLATVAGWGLTDELGQKEPDFLLKVSVPLIDRATCNEDVFPKARGWEISKDMLCASTRYNKMASCPGDSGGPLVLSSKGKTMQIGVVSWGSACRSSGKPQTSNVEVYAAVSEAYPWIKSKIK